MQVAVHHCIRWHHLVVRAGIADGQLKLVRYRREGRRARPGTHMSVSPSAETTGPSQPLTLEVAELEVVESCGQHVVDPRGVDPLRLSPAVMAALKQLCC